MPPILSVSSIFCTVLYLGKLHNISTFSFPLLAYADEGNGYGACEWAEGGEEAQGRGTAKPDTNAADDER